MTQFKDLAARIVIPALALCMIWPQVSSGAALLLGVAVALSLGNPYATQMKTLTKRMLALSIVGLGCGMDLRVIAQTGLNGVGYTLIGIAFVMGLGALLTRWLRIEGETGLLVAVGTAICGGSAIAAVAQVTQAKHQEVSVALGTVFVLNALALFLFPWLGHKFGLTEQQFGLWSGLAIHDTSSVVGATMQFGPAALAAGTATKLTRALWIVPLALVVERWRAFRRTSAPGNAQSKGRGPWFILGFVIAAALVTYVPALSEPGQFVAEGARRGLVVTLFLIGASLTRSTLATVGFRPFVQGVVLWVAAGSVTLGAILMGWIA